MMQIVLIGLGAGAASALLFASIASGSSLSFVLANFAQLPILLAAIGWTHHAALVAALAASVGLAIVTTGSVAFAFLVGIAFPAWWIGYLALLARPAPGPDPAAVEWYPVGRIVVWTAIAAAAIVVVTMFRYGLDAAQINAGLRRELERALRFLSGARANSPLQFPGVKDPERLLDILVLVVPPMKATALTVTSLLNLWLAALIVRISGRLKRPWPQISQMSFPPFASTVLAIAIAGTFLPDFIGLVSGVFTASLLLAYALLGLAVLHAVTQGLTGRGFMLTGLYFTVGLFGWPIVLMSLIGLLETLVGLRARVAARRGPPAAPGPINPP
jgi:magnesium-transporting ATPase (P-type)